MGRLTARGEDVGRYLREGIRLDGLLFVVEQGTRGFFQSHRIPVGTPVDISLNPTTWEVETVRVIGPPPGWKEGGRDAQRPDRRSHVIRKVPPDSRVGLRKTIHARRELIELAFEPLDVAQ